MRPLHWLKVLLSLLLVMCTSFLLCACPMATVPGGKDTPGGDDKPSGDDKPGGDDTPGDDDTPAVTPEAYGNGAPVKGGGATIAEGAFALTATTYDPATATEIAANAFFRTQGKQPGQVFRVNDGKTVTVSGSANQIYNGGGAVLIAPQGVVIEGCGKVTLENVVIIGSVTVKGCESLTMEQVEIVSEGTALTVDAATSGFQVNDCRLSGKTALSLSAQDSIILYSYLAFTENGLVDTAASGTNLHHCVLEGSGTGIQSAARACDMRNNTLRLTAESVGFSLSEGVVNGLLALNVVEGAQTSVQLSGVDNTAVILNSLVSVEANDSKHLYVCDNSLGGRLTAKNNDYILADGNTYPDDGFDHATLQEGNTNHNGDGLTDVNARLEVGADEALLPHVDKELFVGVPRMDAVKDVLTGTETAVAAYLLERSQTEEYVILAPGAYSTGVTMDFNSSHNNTKIYGYGAYIERDTDLSRQMGFFGAENIAVKGLTLGFKQQSCGQVYVLEKLGYQNGKLTVRVITGAGMMNEFGNTNTNYYNTTGIGTQRAGAFYAYCDANFKTITKNNVAEALPTMDMEVADWLYGMLKVGDVLTSKGCNGGTTMLITNGSRDISFTDFTLYGNSAGMAFAETDTLSGVVYNRVYDTTRNGEIIDEATYNAYLTIEEKYGVDLEISIDDLGRFRGSPCHIGSIDATHTTRCAQGSQATSCLFENMCDDATNQNAMHARLAEVKDNGDGTATLIYKANLADYHYAVYGKLTNPVNFCADFKVGDRVFIYTAAGQLVCDTPALSATQYLGSESFSWADHGFPEAGTGTVEKRSVTVDMAAINMAAIAGLDLRDNHHRTDNKVLVDNMSQASNGFKFDNCKFQNIRSRGLLIKASGGTIQNCTFRNIGMSSAAILYEIWWGESGVTENMLVDRNLIDHTGFFENRDNYSPISIEGLGQSVDEDYLLYKNITISNNRIINRTTNYAVYINSAKDVKIINNYFGEFVGNDFTNHTEAPESASAPKPVIHINGAMNVEISGNRYPLTGSIQDQIVAERNKNVYGSDVELDGIPLFPDSLN